MNNNEQHFRWQARLQAEGKHSLKMRVKIYYRRQHVELKHLDPQSLHI